MKKAKIGKFQIDFALLIILLILMPMHTLIFARMLANYKFFNLWRDFIIIFLASFSINGRIKNNIFDFSLLLSIVFIIFYSFCSGRMAALNVARTYCVPILIFFYTRNRKFSYKEYGTIIRTLMYTATIIAVWGLFQAFVLGPEIMFKLGYEHNGNRFTSTSFYINGWTQQRVIGTFSSPNACGAFFAVMIVLLVNFRNKVENRKLFWICITIITIGLLGTFSRSAWIGCLLGLLFFNHKKIHFYKKNARFILVGVIFFSLVLVFLSGTSMYKTMHDMLVDHIGNTIKQQDTSFAYHLQQLYTPIREIIKHPLGLGFGTNGSMALAYLPVEQTHQVESSLWLMTYELGIIGVFVYFFPYTYILVHFGREKSNELASCAAKICLCTLMTYLVLPSVQNFEAPFYVMLFAGMAACTERNFALKALQTHSNIQIYIKHYDLSTKY